MFYFSSQDGFLGLLDLDGDREKLDINKFLVDIETYDLNECVHGMSVLALPFFLGSRGM